MNTKPIIAIVGATGRLAQPVVRELLLQGFQVRAIVRDIAKAQKTLPSAVTFVQGNVTDKNSLIASFKGVDYVYINLSSDEVSPGQSFYNEREGIKNIVEACEHHNIKQILKISALGAYPHTQEPSDTLQNQLRRQGHQYIEQSQIPFTIFHPSWFLDSIFWGINKNTLQWIGKPVKFYWTNSTDYARQVVRAVGNPQSFYKHYAVQGNEKMDYLEIVNRLKADFNPQLKTMILPVGLVRFIGFFSPKMKHLAELFGFYEKSKEVLYAHTTWDDLEHPKTSLEEFALQFKGANISYL